MALHEIHNYYHFCLMVICFFPVSTNGTVINMSKVVKKQTHLLQNGDVIHFVYRKNEPEQSTFSRLYSIVASKQMTLIGHGTHLFSVLQTLLMSISPSGHRKVPRRTLKVIFEYDVSYSCSNTPVRHSQFHCCLPKWGQQKKNVFFSERSCYYLLNRNDGRHVFLLWKNLHWWIAHNNTRKVNSEDFDFMLTWFHPHAILDRFWKL